MKTIEQGWKIRSIDSKESPVSVFIGVVKKQDQIIKALKKSVVFLALAFVTLFIPVIHFILPPLFIIIAAVFFFKEITARHHVSKGQTLCPCCLNKFEVQDQSFKNRLRIFCSLCREQLTLEKKD